MSIEARFVLTRSGAAGAAFVLDVELKLPTCGVGILGSSGSGKTTLLRCIAGLERPQQGRLSVNGEVWQDATRTLPVHRRAIGYVFQESSLFPHLSTRDNLRFGFERVPSAQRKVSFDRAVGLLGVEALLPRRTHTLSGGERQRVAIARALLTSPSLLLLDEPVASLDMESRGQVLAYLEEVQRALAIPMLYVSHTPGEVARVAEHAVVMERGKVLASAALNAVLTDPRLPLSRREDAAAVLDATVEAHDEAYHLTHLTLPGGRLSISRRTLAPGARTKVQIHARDVSLSLAPPSQSSISNVLSVHVRALHAERDPAHRLVELDLGGQTVLARVTGWSVDQLQIRPGLRVFAQIKGVALVE
jgi:molybdate transport system ATP-binding protein